jgi:hypothetical protein
VKVSITFAPGAFPTVHASLGDCDTSFVWVAKLASFAIWSCSLLCVGWPGSAVGATFDVASGEMVLQGKYFDSFAPTHLYLPASGVIVM